MRFAAGYGCRTYVCSVTNLRWIRIYATRDICAGEELYLDYGEDFWISNNTFVSPDNIHPMATPTTLSPSPIRRASTTNDKTPALTPTLRHSTPTTAWAPATTSPRIQGYYNTHTNSHTTHHKHAHTMNDTLPPNNPTHNDTLILNDTITIIDNIINTDDTYLLYVNVPYPP